MTETEELDIRTVRTRKKILASFAELLSEKSFEAIRISDISSRAMINRATFYNHFSDKYQLLDVLTQETLLTHLRANLNTEEVFSPEFIKKIYLVLTSYHTEMASMCKNNYVEELALYTNRFLRENVKSTILNSIRLKFPQGDLARLEMLSSILSWFVIGLAYEWKKSKQKSAEEFFNQFQEDYENIVLEINNEEYK